MTGSQNVPADDRSATEGVVLTTVRDGIGWITLNRPEAMNAVTVELGRQLQEAVANTAGRARVLVIRGINGNFSVGGDFNELQRLRAEGREAMEELFQNFQDACIEIGNVPVPVIAAVEGYAMAGGFELMQSCDIAVVHENCQLADTHLNHGQVPGGGGSQKLPRLVGRQRAAAHILTGDRLNASDAVAWGLAYKSFPAATFEDDLTAFAQNLASKDASALAKSKWLIRQSMTLSLDQGLSIERQTVLDHLSQDGAGTGIREFTQKKAAK